MKRHSPETSKDAYKKVTSQMLQTHYGKIIKALQVLGTANYETIANHMGMADRNQVSRRMKELEGLEMVYKPGTKSLTKSGRNAFNYCLTGQGLPKTDNEVTYKEGVKNASNYANELIKSTQQSLFK